MTSHVPLTYSIIPLTLRWILILDGIFGPTLGKYTLNNCWYPQVCHIVFRVKDLTEEFVNLTMLTSPAGDAIRYAGNVQLHFLLAFNYFQLLPIHIHFLGDPHQIEYTIKATYISLGKTSDNISECVVTVVLKRNTVYHLANTVLQIFILLLISYMSFYFDLENFSDRIMMTLTTMLVITTILSAIQAVCSKHYLQHASWK